MKILYFFLISILLSLSLYAQTVELKPYGFLRGDAIYSSRGVLSFGLPNLSAPQVASGLDEAALGFTGKNSRVGLKGTYGEAIKVGGVVEIDFFSANSFDTNANPRLRLAYASLVVNNFEFRFGQQWDLFSPLNPNTVNVNANLWYGGNLGFRRGQIQIGYKIPVNDIQPVIQLALAETARETGSGLGDDNKAAIPMVQGRLSVKFLENKMIGVYFVYAKFSPAPDTSDYDYHTSGFGMDLTFPLHKYFRLHGEINSGTNLHNSNFFTVAGNGDNNDERRTLALWANVNSAISDHFQLVFGGGLDENQTDDLSDGSTDQNIVIYGDLVFPIAYGFSISIEIGHISTTITGNDEENTAWYSFLSGQVTF